MQHTRSLALGAVLLMLCAAPAQSFCPTSLHYCVELLPSSQDNNMLLGIVETLKQATVAPTVNSALSVVLAQAICGGLGGLASRSVADLIGDKKIDTKITKVSATTVFFVIRAVVRLSLRFTGIPLPITILLASILASVLSEVAKYIGRSQRKSVKESVEDLLLDGVVLKGPEIAGDVSKWVFYDVAKEMARNPLSYNLDDYPWLFDKFVEYVFEPFNSNVLAESLIVFLIGAMSGIVDIAVREFVTLRGRSNGKIPAPTKTFQLRYSEYALEGGILFLAYETILKVVSAVAPADLNSELAFEKLMDSVELELQRF